MRCETTPTDEVKSIGNVVLLDNESSTDVRGCMLVFGQGRILEEGKSHL